MYQRSAVAYRESWEVYSKRRITDKLSCSNNEHKTAMSKVVDKHLWKVFRSGRTPLVPRVAMQVHVQTWSVANKTVQLVMFGASMTVPLAELNGKLGNRAFEEPNSINIKAASTKTAGIDTIIQHTISIPTKAWKIISHFYSNQEPFGSPLGRCISSWGHGIDT